MAHAFQTAVKSPSRSLGRTSSHAPMIMRQAAPGSRDILRPKADRCACGGSCPRCVSAVLRTPSRKIDAADRRFVERRLGHDFAAVRLHDDNAATATAESLGARAWTLGEHVVLGRGEYRPGHDAYRRLLAHELAHVLQQRGVAQSAPTAVASAHDAFEREADRIAADALSPGVQPASPVRVSASPAAVQRALQTDPSVPVQENLAERIVTGGDTAGFVLIKLNDKVLNLKDDPAQAVDPKQADPVKADARAAINRPRIDQKNYKVDGPSGKVLHADGWIAEVPLNKLTTEVHTLTTPPWVTTTTKADVRAAVPDIRLAHCVGADPCQFTVKGLPDGATLAAETLAHENQHAADIATAFETVFRPWDTQMQLAKDTDKVFSGVPKQATSDLWNFLGGPPEVIADAFVDKVDALGNLMHAGMAEPKLALKNPSAAPDCSTAEVGAEGGK